MISRRALLAAASALPAAAAQDRRAVILARAKALDGYAGQRIVAASAETVARAEKAVAGVVYFYGRTPVEVGLQNIDWSGAHIKHQEWPAQLNRFFHLGPLAAAYAGTHDERFARAARAYIEDWIRGDPYPDSPRFRPGDNALTMSIRLGSSHAAGWGGTLPAFLASPAFDDAFLDSLFASLARQAGYLSARLTAVGNWRISQLDALVFTALRFPFLPGASDLLRIGVDGMRNALATQFLPDGVHVERTPGYHDWMAQVAVNYFDLARRFPEADAKVSAERAVRALDYGAHAELFGVNDSMAPHRDPASLSRLATRANALATMKLTGRYPDEPALDQVFPDAGQVFARTSWKPGAQLLAFDASTWGGGHCHLSRLSFVLRGGGRMLVADPCILTYEMSDPTGPYGKSTAAHSTLNVDGANQSGADPRLLHTAFTREAALIHARYQGGYWPGLFRWGFNNGKGAGIAGDHDRVVFWVRNEYLIVIDSLATEPDHSIRNCFQMGPMEKWTHDPKALRWQSANAGANVLLQLVVPPAGTEMQVFEGSREPLRGWVGHHGDDCVPAPLVEFRYPAPNARPVQSVALIAPFTGADAPAIRVSAPRPQRLVVSLPGGRTDHIAWTSGLDLPIEDPQSFTTDARFLWLREGGPQFLLGGSYLRRA
jgi:hypothetical protein